MPRYDDDDDRPRRRRPRDDDDDRPRARRRVYRDDDEDDDRPRRKKARPRAKQMSTLGAIALGIGGLGLMVSFMPCFASKSLIPAGIGLIVGFVALVLAHQSDGRQGYGMPIAAMSVSFAAVLIGVGWLFLGKQIHNWLERKDREYEAREAAEDAREEARHKAELAKAAKDVQAANPDTVTRVSAIQFYQAWDNDEDRFDRFYKNKVIEVTGTVDELNLAGETYTVLLKAGAGSTVNCEFAKDPGVRDRLTQLRPGQTVTIRGKCLGGFPSLEACVLVQ